MDIGIIRWAGAAMVLGAVVSCGGGDGPITPTPSTGTVSGTVMANGAGVSGAQVSLTGKGTQTTSTSGAFTFTQVSAGTHTITLTLPDGLELDGNQTLEKSVTVTSGQTATVSWTLREKAPLTVTTDTVRLVGTSFSPSTLTVKVGSTVVWLNTQAVVHTVTPSGHSQWARTETNSVGEVLRATINAAGEFEYFCEPHQSMGMTGKIVVQP